MKKIYLSTLLTFFALSIFGQAPTNGLVAHYKMDGNANDETGVNNGIQQGGVNFTTATDRFGLVGKAAGFDGIDDYITANFPSQNTVIGQFSISSWVYINDFYNQSWFPILEKPTASNEGSFHLSYENSSPNLICGVLGVSGSNTFSHRLYKGQWYNIIITYNGSSKKIFINGILITNLPNSGSVTLTNTPLNIGKDSPGLVEYSNGKLDDIRIYNRALTDTEVQQLYQAEAPPIDITTGLVAHYKMDGNAQDASGFNNHGTQQGGVNFSTATDRFEVAGKAAGFNGTNSIISVPNSSTIQNINSITLSTWVNYSGLAVDGTIPILNKSNSSVGGQYFFRLYNNGNNSFSGTLNGQHGGLPFTGIQPGTWYNLTMVSTNNIFTFYLNGQKIGSVSGSGTGFSNTMPLTLGANPSGVLEVLNGKLDDIRIYNRALSDADIKAIYDLENNISLTNIKIEPILESINQQPYEVPREATVHHYFLAKDNITGAKLKDVTVVYQYGPFLHQSVPTDTSGLIDLNIMVGGLNPNSSNDDWSPVGTQTVTFHSLLVGNVTGTNAFTPFDITVIDKAEPIDKEIGLAFGLKLNVYNLDVAKEFKSVLGGIPLKMGFGSLSLGVSGGPTFKIKKLNQDVWNIKLGGDIGAFGSLSIGPEVSFGNNKLNVNGEIKVGVGADIATRPEINFDLNLNDAKSCFKFASIMFYHFAIINATYGTSLKSTAKFFENAANLLNSNNPFTAKGYKIGASISAEASANISLGFEKNIFNLQGNGNNLAFGGGLNLETSFGFTSEVSHENTYNEGYTFENTVTAGAELNGNFDLISNLTKRSNSNGSLLKVENIPLNFYSQSQYNTFTLQNFFDTNKSALGGVFTYSSQNIRSDLFQSQTYKINILNNWEYSQRALNTIRAYYFGNDSYGNTLKNNALAAFFSENKTLLGSLWRQYPDNTSFYKQSFDFHKLILNNATTSWTADDIKLSQTREVSLSREGEYPLEIPLLKDNEAVSLGGFTYSSWNTYTHDFKKGRYIKSLNKALLTLDYPDIYTNIEVPQEEPIQYFWTKLKTHVETLTTQLYNQAYSFLKETRVQFISQLTILTNYLQSRTNMAGEIMYDPKSKDLNLATNVPSVFTFTINPSPQVFSNTTSLDFKYYYPENEQIGITQTDTFRVISDLFTLKATDGITILSQAPNGNFTIETNFSSSDLGLASLPLNLVPRVIFQARGNQLWEDIGAVNQTINFNRLGSYAIGVKISNDNISPTISVISPTNFVSPNYISVNLSDNKSGIDWAKTQFFANGNKVSIQRVGTTNEFRIPIIDLPSNPQNVYAVQIITYDLAKNRQFYDSVLPCNYNMDISTIGSLIEDPILRKASNKIESNAKLPNNKDILFKAGKALEFKNGFEINSNKSFKAEIGGCEN